MFISSPVTPSPAPINPSKKTSLAAGGMVTPPKQAGGMIITTVGNKKKHNSSIFGVCLLRKLIYHLYKNFVLSKLKLSPL